MAEDEAEARQVTPQEALLDLVRTASRRATYMDQVVGEKLRRHVDAGGDPLDPPRELVRWIRESRDERMAATRTAKAAVDAGVMTALERRLDMEGEMVASTLAAVLDALDLPQEQRIFALGVAQATLVGEALPAAPAADAPVLERERDLAAEFRQFAEREGFDPGSLDEGDDDDDTD
jgi:hypothetical protein